MVTKAADLIVLNLALYDAHMSTVRDYLEQQLEVSRRTDVSISVRCWYVQRWTSVLGFDMYTGGHQS